MKVGSQGRKARPPTATATSAGIGRRQSRDWGARRRARSALENQPQAHHRHQVHRPVLGVEQGGRHHRDGDEVARPRCGQGALEGHDPAAGEEDQQGIHAGLGGVVHGEGGAGQEHHGRPGHHSPPEPLGGQPRHRQRQDAQDARERTSGQVRLAEESYPEMQEVVEERRCAVLFESTRDLVQRQPGDVDGQGLVEPEGG